MIDPLSVATDGYIGNALNTLSIAVNGYLLTITITDLPTGGGYPAGAASKKVIPIVQSKKPVQKEKETVDKKITVVVTIGNKSYTKSKIVKNQPNLTIDDIDVDVNRDYDKPKIKIELKEQS